MTIFVIVGIMTEAHSFTSQVGIGSESECLLGLSNKILEFIFRGTGLKTEKSGRATGGEGECREVEEELLASERRSLDILSVKKEAKRSAFEVAADEEGKGEADLWFRSLFEHSFPPNASVLFSALKQFPDQVV